MKITLAVSIFLFSGLVFANQKEFNLELELYRGGQHLSSPKINVLEGETAHITQNNNGQITFIEVVAKKDKTTIGKEAINMHIVLGEISKNGSRQITDRVEVTTAPNVKTEMAPAQKNVKEPISFSVIANEVVL